jgi:hypothetical protein
MENGESTFEKKEKSTHYHWRNSLFTPHLLAVPLSKLPPIIVSAEE